MRSKEKKHFYKVHIPSHITKGHTWSKRARVIATFESSNASFKWACSNARDTQIPNLIYHRNKFWNGFNSVGAYCKTVNECLKKES